MERKPTIIELNRVSSMLESDDPEMQELGVATGKELLSDRIIYHTGHPVKDMKHSIAARAYKLGHELGAEILRLKASGLWK